MIKERKKVFLLPSCCCDRGALGPTRLTSGLTPALPPRPLLPPASAVRALLSLNPVLGMKSSMRQWRRLVLVGILAWGLIFLTLFSYLLDARVNELLTSAGSLLSQHPDTRRLTSIQASHLQNGVATTTLPGDVPEPEPRTGSEVSRSPNSAAYGSQESSRLDYLDPQTLAAWSSFGTENVGSHSDPVTQSHEKSLSQTAGHQNSSPREGEEDDERENADEEKGNETKTEGVRKAADASSDLEENDFSRSASVLKRLWQGRLSADMLDPWLQRVQKGFLNANNHYVAYKGPRRASQSAKELLCQMKTQARLSTVDGSEEPFSSLGWARLVPSLGLEQLHRSQSGNGFRTCAVVSSAGSILRSGLGREIDAHDAVMRLNAAPTEGYEKDVGNKTTIRVINSKVIVSPEHHFKTSPLYKNVTLVAWDPPPYSLNLHKWFTGPDFNLFGPYVERRKSHPDQPFYILHPRYLWGLWDVIQANTLVNIQPNPPSTGFIGILLMMALCEQVHVYEFLPSARKTDLCHYFERYLDAACTLGAYHPLLYEKNLIQRINGGSEADLRAKGRVTLPGFRTVDCDI
ncbi:beta-galactoside alpha-2,6-sialyltransferase 2 isoform X2 [Syngnathoides biaculeatus]|uniref:beta-galactoside alpha-2,6-sialyltransferase 2 isoform X2 n=1 Tax=Syngnathoides biaculeatus TaxID=300417 RepID=UPI002ADE8966|nr:beta-galactoside alpha-2,6-sialyltransferase 2 isoform X2 [Syngnathoides biaculeatus]XP_061697554.1 beta-galactoside alpha-2,6-sialyltransferase 2 isoform X2 [Syngnathoides biaculeatus]XP_061697555.1 beta-galactoside alpha-2,6-sialyltransferase 2 isoform X2 [Syngnathoides biaculeatus]XP_061697557.1 beta-galactoside alpha-2,6-sialyltransferase 2 isoform X2 [Syngnathoides biaculeatus]